MHPERALDNRLAHGRRVAAVAAAVGAALCAPGAMADWSTFLPSYLNGYLLCWMVTVGCLGVLMLHYLVGGRWGAAARPLLESGALAMPLVALLFVPLALGVERIYPWARASESGADVPQKFAYYLKPSLFQAGPWGYFALWLMLVLATCLGTVKPGRPPRWLRRVSAGGLVLLVLSVSFAAIDWGMSLDPAWYSTMYPVLFVVGAAVLAFAWTTIVATSLAPTPGPEFHGESPLADLGTLLLAFVMLWAYVTFSQYLIIWSGDLPEEVSWYVVRLRDGWQWVALAVALLGFVVPFGMLLSRDVKHDPRRLRTVAVTVGLAQVLSVAWIILPAFRETLSSLRVADFAAPLALVGLWIVVSLSCLKFRGVSVAWLRRGHASEEGAKPA